MLKQFKLAVGAAALAILIAACGGDGESEPPLYGAIAVNPNSVLTMGITTNQATESAAVARAELNCGPNCKTQRVFATPNKCGALAYDSGQRLSAWGVGATNEEAQTAALLNCKKGGGNFCTPYLSGCNDR